MPSVPHDDVMAEIFREDPAYAVALLNDILGDDEASPGELLVVLRQIAKANGGLPAIAEKAALNPTQMYRTLSLGGNPSLTSLTAILKALGMQLVVKKRKGVALIEAALPQRTRKKPARAQTSAPAKVKAAH